MTNLRQATHTPNPLREAVRTALFASMSVILSAPVARGAEGLDEGFIIAGFGAGSQSGTTVRAAGDVNGDGLVDILIGAPFASVHGREQAGAGYVLYGRTQSVQGIYRLANLLPRKGGDGSEGFIVEGIEPDDHTCWTIAGIGDVNGDGIDDFGCGAPGSNRSFVYVVFGSQDGFPATVRLSSLLPGQGGDGSRGFVIDYGLLYGSTDIGAAGDINGDGIDDMVFSGGSKIAPPQAYVLFGRRSPFPASIDLLTLEPGHGGDGSLGFIIFHVSGFDLVDASAARLRDVNADGIDDIALGSPAGPGVFRGIAEAYVVYGRSTSFPAQVNLSEIFQGDNTQGFVLEGIGRDQGIRVGDGGDLNGDDVADVVISSNFADPGGKNAAGESYVFFGGTQIPALTRLETLVTGDGSQGTVLSGIDALDYSGRDSRIAGDINGDGIEDLIIGASGADHQDKVESGEAYVVFGRRDGFSGQTYPGDLFERRGGDGSKGFVILGIESGDAAGSSVSGAGDVNGDGIDDLLVGAPGADFGGGSNIGATYVIYGRPSFPPTLPLLRLQR